MLEQTWTHMSKHYYSIWSPSHAIDAHLNLKKYLFFLKVYFACLREVKKTPKTKAYNNLETLPNPQKSLTIHKSK